MSLAGFLRERWELVEADFQRFYGLDLRREVRRASVRRLKVLVTGLPPEAVCWRQESILVERMDLWFHTVVGLLAKRNVTMPEPLILASPRESADEQPKEKRKATVEEMVAWFSNNGFGVNPN